MLCRNHSSSSRCCVFTVVFVVVAVSLPQGSAFRPCQQHRQGVSSNCYSSGANNFLWQESEGPGFSHAVEVRHRSLPLCPERSRRARSKGVAGATELLPCCRQACTGSAKDIRGWGGLFHLGQRRQFSRCALRASLGPSAERYGLWPAIYGMAEAMPLTKQCHGRLFAQFDFDAEAI
jgi:hypothetical protein